MFFEYLNIARKVLVAHKFRSMLTVLSINFLGDGLRDALDPTLRS